MVPRITPTKHQNKLTGVSATEKPSKRLLRASIGQSSRVSLKSPESRGQRNIEGGDENQLERNGETDTDTFTFPFSDNTSSTVPLKSANGPSVISTA